MRILTLILLLFSLNIQKSNAQNDSLDRPRRGYIGISLGPSFPLSIQAQEGLGNLKGTRGLNFNLIDFGYFFTDHFGIAAKWAGSSYGFSVSDLSYYSYDAFLDNNQRVRFRSDDWSCGTLMLGVRFAKQNKKATQSVGLFFGFLSSKTPEIDFVDSTFVLQSKQTGEGTALALGIDARVNYHLGKRFDFIFGLGFLFAKPEYEFDVDYRPGFTRGNFKQELDLLNFDVGLAYRLK